MPSVVRLKRMKMNEENHPEKGYNKIDAKNQRKYKGVFFHSFSLTLCIFLKKKRKNRKEKSPIYNAGYIFCIDIIPVAKRFALSLTVLLYYTSIPILYYTYYAYKEDILLFL